MKKILNDKRGISYIWTCILLLFIMALTMVGLEYAQVYHVVRRQKEEIQIKLDSYITKYAVEKYDSVKQGSVFDVKIDYPKLVNGVLSEVPLTGTEKYEVSNLTVNALKSNSFGIQVQYELKVPFTMFNKKIADITAPVTLISQFKQK